jgi:quinohemoprotein ethanol dehydrogenase
MAAQQSRHEPQETSRMKKHWIAVLAVALGSVVPLAHAQAPAKGTEAHIRAVTSRIDGRAIAHNPTTRDWPSYGLDYAETRYSRLDQVNEQNVKQLGLAWSYNLESTRGVEATPLVVDGIMYVTASWSVVHAIDVRTGKRIWTYDPKVPRDHGVKGCCDVVNRGVALHKGKVYVGSFDARLIALDAATGKPVWEKDTSIDRKRPYTITGAPRVFKGMVVIGNGGAEYGVRGYITAYDAETGAEKWRFFTVPGDPAKPYEQEALARAAKTWDPSNKYWEAGGGGTVWDSITFDPQLNLIYIGTGNGSPWARRLRSPGGGDNLYLASIVAINPDTGKYVWHYQETPGDNWDYTSTQPMILADIKLQGKTRKVILHAPKNGFFFVIDRSNGKFISARNFVDVNWASGYDDKGFPIETANARSEKSTEQIPGPLGAHNWHPMSYSPKTGLVYLPAQNIPISMMDNKAWKMDVMTPGAAGSNQGWNTAFFLGATPTASKPFGRLIAWDPVAQKEAWRHEHVSPWNGGTLVTAGNLVFQGSAEGRFFAFNARTGEKLWETPTGTGVIAAPATYMVDGKQYVSIAVGWGGSYGVYKRAHEKVGPGTVYTFVVGGQAPLPEFAQVQQNALLAGVAYDPKHVPEGQGLYVASCVLCHGVPGVDRGGNIPNLGYSHPDVINNLEAWVLGGVARDKGMPDFTGKIKPEDIPKLKAFIQGVPDSIRPKK